MDTFAFIIHPIHPKRDIQRKFPLLGYLANDWMIDHLSPLFPPVYLSQVDGITSFSTGKQVKGWLLACPLSPQHFSKLPEHKVYRKIIETGHLAEKLGARILGLGAYTSVVGDSGLTIAAELQVPVTTGDSYTVAVAVQAVLAAARILEIPVERATAVVVGATGAIGRACATLLNEAVGRLLLVSRNREHLEQFRDELVNGGSQAEVVVSTDLADIRQAQLVLTVTSAVQQIIQPEHLQPGCVVCDVARPRDVSSQVAAQRPDVLVIDGGMVEVPGMVDFHFDFGLPPGKAFACMAETIALALEGRFEDYTLGKQISSARVGEITSIAERHGFRLSGFRSFERPVTQEQMDNIFTLAKRTRAYV